MKFVYNLYTAGTVVGDVNAQLEQYLGILMPALIIVGLIKLHYYRKDIQTKLYNLLTQKENENLVKAKYFFKEVPLHISEKYFIRVCQMIEKS